jgi:hypothetical protein
MIDELCNIDVLHDARDAVKVSVVDGDDNEHDVIQRYCEHVLACVEIVHDVSIWTVVTVIEFEIHAKSIQRNS